MSATSMTKTSLDYMAEGFWQDFLAKRPIAGGVAYEDELSACELDETLESLQRVDGLLSQIRRDNTKRARGEAELLAELRFRHLLLFLAFYAGRVLARHWQSSPHWYGQTELRRSYPELSLSVDDFYQEMALAYQADNRQTELPQQSSALFFALEPIGLRLFGHIDRQFVATQGGHIASGLYQAVKERLPKTTPATEANQDSRRPKLSIASTSIIKDKQNIEAQPAETKPKPFIDSVLSTSTAPSKPSKTDITPIVATDIEVSSHSDALVSSDFSSQPITDNKIIKKAPKPTPELFMRLLNELDEIEVPQNAGVEEYQRACQILDQFERHIAKQHKPRAQVKFSDTHKAARQQALDWLQQSANAGHSAAMLRLAMYELLDEGITDAVLTTSDDRSSHKDKAIRLVKQAADANDSRAQRLLSKLYYQGFGLTQDMAMGRYWLEQAADNGHPEAMTITRDWQQAQLLMSTKAQEQHSLKRYQLLIAIVAILALLLIIFV